MDFKPGDEVVIPVRLDEGVTMPEYATEFSAGMDLRCSVDFQLEPMERRLIPTGVRIAIPEGFEGQVRPRSGLAVKHGISVVNSPGTIDSDYRGEIQVILVNLGGVAVRFERGERIAQLVISPVAKARLVVIESLDETGRGEGGFGSTGVG